MSFPFYVNPEQMTQDKAEFARKGIARGKSIVTMEYDSGILMVAENPLRLQKLGEIYDRIAFAGVGKFSEFDRLRKMGVQWADVEGYRFSRDDVRAKALANLYSQALGEEFTRSHQALRGGDRGGGSGRRLARPRAERSLSGRLRRHDPGPGGLLHDRRRRRQPAGAPRCELSTGHAAA